MRILALAMVLPLGGCLVSDELKDAAVENKKAEDTWDADGDNIVSKEFGGTDCDDTNAAIFPGASELCDGYDNDCNGNMDGQNEVDADGDAYLACTVTGNTVLNPQFLGSGDCNDSDNTIFPGATEICDEVDNNCDGVADEADAVNAPSWYTDADGDNYGDDDTEVVDCVQPADTVEDGGDCNDEDAAVHPGATEQVGNGVDDNCDFEELCYVDSDNDGHAILGDDTEICMDMSCGCDGVADNTVPRDDCNDAVASIHPGADEFCNGIDDDCDGTTDEIDAEDVISWYVDADNDGFGAGSVAQPSCTAISGRADNHEDCDDDDAAVNPNATEVCGDEIDNDCSGDADGSDAADAVLWYEDADGDGQGYGTTSLGPSCLSPSGWANNADDCDDNDDTVYRLATEICDGLDNDCDGTIPTDERDGDGDRYVPCTIDSGGWDSATLQIDGGGDCNDGDAAVNPAATETCNGADNNCDGDTELNASDGTTFYLDSDNDGHGDTNNTIRMCSLPSGYSAELGDCDDNDATVNPTATELCDGLDNDCDGAIPADELDSDNDLYVECTVDAGGWDDTAFIILGGDDCDDSVSQVHPGATEACDGVDTDCDGLTPKAELDVDGDGFVECTWHSLGTSSWLGATVPTGGDDCNDDEFDINPAAAEHCGGADSSIDYNCDGDFEAGSPEGTIFYEDFDADGLTNSTSTETFCNAPSSGWLAAGALTDCDDSDATVGLATAWYHDNDGDGYGGEDIQVECTAPTDFVNNGDDCDDTDAFTYPGAAENEVQNPGMCMTDADEDGWGKDFSLVAVVGTDCDDSDAAINPAATEISNNNVDEDCDGTAQATLLAVGLGVGNSCAVDDTNGTWGGLHCWGMPSHSIVTHAPTDSSYADVAVGVEDACALDRNGRLTCWGGTPESQYSILPPSTIDYHSLSMGLDHGCALDVNSSGSQGGYEADCWGKTCSSGECDVPLDFSMQEYEYLDVAAGMAVSCGVEPAGTLRCWGDSQTEVMQNYANTGGFFSSVALSPMEDVGCGLGSSGEIECFGLSTSALLNSPSGIGFSELSCGAGSCCALTSNSAITCWGHDSVLNGIPGGTGWTTVSVGQNMACAIDGGDELTCWGGICAAFDPVCTDHP
jgi:hypothetical protein